MWNRTPEVCGAVAMRLPDAPMDQLALPTIRLLEPHGILARDMHAAVLLMEHHHPQEAVRLTLQNMALLPMNPDARLNHGMALGFNGRASAAAAVLGGLPVRSPSATQRNHGYPSWFDAHGVRLDWGKARERSRLMDQGLRLPL